MRKRLLTSLLAGGLMAAMLPGVSAAEGIGHAHAGAVKDCREFGQTISGQAQGGAILDQKNFGGLISTYFTPSRDGTVPHPLMGPFCDPGPNAL